MMKYETELDDLIGAVLKPLNDLEKAEDDSEKFDLINEAYEEIDNLEDRLTTWAIFLDDLVEKVKHELEVNMP